MTRRTLIVATATAALAMGVAGSAGLRPALAQSRVWTNQVTLSDLHSVTCTSTSDCWAVGSNSTAPVVYNTTNGGQTWAIQTVAGALGVLQSVYCQSNGMDCWAVGSADAGSGTAGAIYSTTDGGANWSGAKVTGAATTLNAIACPGSGTSVTCVAVGTTGPTDQPTSGIVLQVAGDLSSITPVSVPSAVAALTGVACQGTSNCVATGVSTQDPATGVYAGALIHSTNGGGAWTATTVPAGLTSLAGVTCPSSGNCAAVGYGAPNGVSPGAIVINGGVSATTWSGEAHISGVEYLDGIACPAPATCLAAGYSGLGSAATAELAWTTNGTTWSTQSAGPGYLDAVACPAAGTCQAAGYQALGSSGSGGIDALTMGSGSWTVQSQVALGPRVGLTGVSCASSANCVAVGNSATGPVIMATTNGGVTWTNQTPPSASGVLYYLSAVACPAATDCVAVGYELSNQSGSQTKTAISTSTSDGSTWSAATVVTGVSHFDAITCPSTGRCVAAGTDITNLATSGLTGIIDTSTNLGGSWTATTVPSAVGYLTGVSCVPSSSTCAAVGGTQTGAATLLTTTTGTSWTVQALPTLPKGTYSDLYDVSCPAKTYCAAVGDQLVPVTQGNQQTDQGQAVILTGSGGSWAVQTPPPNTGALRSVSCPSAMTCEAVGTVISVNNSANLPALPATTAVSTSLGAAWAADTLPTNIPLLRAVGCATGTSDCWAAGTSSIAEAGS
ncbi:MAG TPA: hypothetical protein VKS82_19030 [Streptosporangiaceae bacterium]|nr:hypothetical protein [Streptosporangiaceae bacterium]